MVPMDPVTGLDVMLNCYVFELGSRSHENRQKGLPSAHREIVRYSRNQLAQLDRLSSNPSLL